MAKNRREDFTQSAVIALDDKDMLRLFRKLAARDHILRPVDFGANVEAMAALYELAGGDGAAIAAMPRISARQVEQWFAQDLLEKSGETYRLSSVGRSWLRRALSAGDVFQQQHQERAARIIDFEGSKRPAIINETESPLGWLASRKDKNGAPLLTPFQFEAGERLRADFYFAGLTARVTASWSPTAGSGNSGGANDTANLQDNIMAARQRVMLALAKVGPELSGILVDVCCHLKGLEEAEKAEGWPQRSGKVILQIALTRLARHYGLVSDEQLNSDVRRKFQHWGAEDYRPKISAGDAAS